jgi:mycothiol synthase
VGTGVTTRGKITLAPTRAVLRSSRLVTTNALQRRPVSVADLGAVVELLTASDLAAMGRTDFTVTEVEGDLRNEDTEHQGWFDDAGALVAYGWVSRAGESPKIQLDAYVHPSHDIAVGVELIAALELRGRELAADAGHDHALFDTGAYRHDARTRRWLEARGFEVGTTFTRMRIDLDAPIESIADPAGVTVRQSVADEADLRLAHAIDEESFTEHYGEVAQDFETFGKRFAEHGDGWSRLWLAELDGEPVGLLVGTKQFEEDDDAGYVRRLGVIPAGRGRGVAKALLRHYFSVSRAEGRVAVLLHVDVANVTNAIGVYESVGMRPILEIDAWTKRSAVLTTAG